MSKRVLDFTSYRKRWLSFETIGNKSRTESLHSIYETHKSYYIRYFGYEVFLLNFDTIFWVMGFDEALGGISLVEKLNWPRVV